jgi:hypothetical protein
VLHVGHPSQKATASNESTYVPRVVILLIRCGALLRRCTLVLSRISTLALNSSRIKPIRQSTHIGLVNLGTAEVQAAVETTARVLARDVQVLLVTGSAAGCGSCRWAQSTGGDTIRTDFDRKGVGWRCTP